MRIFNNFNTLFNFWFSFQPIIPRVFITLTANRWKALKYMYKFIIQVNNQVEITNAKGTINYDQRGYQKYYRNNTEKCLLWENYCNSQQQLRWICPWWNKTGSWTFNKQSAGLPQTPEPSQQVKIMAVRHRRRLCFSCGIVDNVFVCLKFTYYRWFFQRFFAWKISTFMVSLNMDIFWHNLFLYFNCFAVFSQRNILI